jgi:hypothetical protein
MRVDATLRLSSAYYRQTWPAGYAARSASFRRGQLTRTAQPARHLRQFIHQLPPARFDIPDLATPFWRRNVSTSESSGYTILRQPPQHIV